MSSTRDLRVSRWISFSGVSSIVSIVTGLSVVAGWLFRFPGLHALHPGFGTMSSHAGFCFVLLGTALLLLRKATAPWKIRVGRAVAAAVVTISLLHPAQSLPALLLGLALMFLDVEVGDTRPSELLAFGAITLVTLVVVAYGYDSVSVVTSSTVSQLPFHTLATFFVLSHGVLGARPKRGLMSIAISDSVGGILVRRLLPRAIAICVIAGWLIVEGERAHLYPRALSLPYFASAMIVIFGTLIWITASSIHAVDVSRLDAEEEIRRLNTELEQRVAERTAQLEGANKELEAFSYSVSHDLRAPLRHISGFIDLLKQHAGDVLDEQGTRYMSIIGSSASEMGRLIDDLLSFSRMGRTEMMTTSVDLRSLVEQVIKNVDQSADTTTKWVVGDLPRIEGDPAMLRVALVNLISNAYKFTKGVSDRQIEIGSTNGTGSELVLYVRDNGVGFEPKYAHKLFGVFQRLHSSHEFEGTGIGLATVRRVIHRHGGKTWAEGAPGQGATFYCSFPGQSKRALAMVSTPDNTLFTATPRLEKSDLMVIKTV